MILRTMWEIDNQSIYEFVKLKKCNVALMTPMAQTNTILGIVYGLVNDKQLNDSNSVYVILFLEPVSNLFSKLCSCLIPTNISSLYAVLY